MNCSTKSFKALMVATFAGAFLELVLKAGVLFLPSAFSSAPLGHVTLFILLALLPSIPAPFVAAWSGLACDRYGKSKVILFIKLFEVLLALGAACALLRDNFWVSYIMIFVLGSSAAAFTTAKFALLPAMLPAQLLSYGNGLIILSKYLAYVSGILVTGLLISMSIDALPFLSALYVSIALLGFIACFMLREEQAAKQIVRTGFLSLKNILTYYREVRASKHLFLSMLSFAFILIIGAVFQFNTSIFLEQGAGFTQIKMSVLLSILSLGIGLGGIIAGFVSRSKVEIGLVPIGAFGVGISLGLSAFLMNHYVLLCATYLVAGISGGICVVPLYALFQQHTPHNKLGGYMGLSQALAYSGLLLVLVLVLLLQSFAAVFPAVIFAIAGLLTLVLSGIALRHTPIALIRCLNWIFTNFVYRIRAYGIENVPAHGGALLVCNHISYFDPMLVSASVQRTVCFLIRRPLFKHKILGPILRTMRAIPISTHDAPKALLGSLKEAREAIQRGELVCVFAEGEPARVGHMLRFSRGLEVIMKGIDAPIIPAYLDQTWGSLFDYVDGKYKLKVPQEIPYPATLTFGKALKPDTSAFDVRQTISELGTEAFSNRRKEHQFLHLGFIKEAKRRPFHTCMVESSGKRITNFKALVAAFLLAKELQKRIVPGSKNVGVFLPPCIGASLANIALLLRNFVPVNMNYTASKEASQSAIQQAQIKQVITGNLFLSKMPGPEGVEFILLDEVVSQVKKKDKILTMLFLLFTPFWILRVLLKTKDSAQDSLATIIFSSGSTGIPKGVMLSHANISSNVEGMFDAVNITRSDVLVGILPFFHAFGFTTGLWLPLLGGVKVLFHFSPLDSEIIGELVRKEKGTVLLGTPTFFMNYIRKMPAENFSSVRLAIAGAEKLRGRVAKAFTDKFGFVPLEGYGCTELSPVAMINLPDIRELNRDQIGNKPGTVGHPIPGVAVKVVDPDTRQELPPETMGLLLVKGPNVMKGYLADPEKTAEVIWDGWYSTGDLATLDQDGFVTLHDRLSRFSKIAGEMIPHGAVEDAIQKVLEEVEPMCIVTSVADERKGERLIVLHTKSLDAKCMPKMLQDAGLPNLWVPRSDDFFLIEQIPLLGSGKLDLYAVKALAEKLAGKKA